MAFKKINEKAFLIHCLISKFCNLGLFFSFCNFIFLICKTRNVQNILYY